MSTAFAALKKSQFPASAYVVSKRKLSASDLSGDGMPEYQEQCLRDVELPARKRQTIEEASNHQTLEVRTTHWPVSSFVENEKSVVNMTVYDMDNKIVEDKGPWQMLRLKVGDKLFFLGQFDLVVISGQVSILGGLLRRSCRQHRVYALPDHPLSSLDAMEGPEPTIIYIHSVENGIENLSRRFTHWIPRDNASGQAAETAFSNRVYGSSYQLLRESTQILLGKRPSELGIPRSWIKFCQSLPVNHIKQHSENSFVPISTFKGSDSLPEQWSILVCGQKDVGKSLFARILSNSLLSPYPNRKLYLLDLDPDQPEYTPPGQVSLVNVKQFAFGPSFTHTGPQFPTPQIATQTKVVKSHSIGATTPNTCAKYFFECSKDLISHLERLNQPKDHDLIIKCPSWLDENGIAYLRSIVELASPSHIVCLGITATLTDFQETMKNSEIKAEFRNLPAIENTIEPNSDPQLRGLQTSAYYHSNSTYSHKLSWNPTPISSRKPIRVFLKPGHSNKLDFIAFTSSVPVASVSSCASQPLLFQRLFCGSSFTLHRVDKDDGLLFPHVRALPPSGPFDDAQIVSKFPTPAKSECLGQGIVVGFDSSEYSWLDLYSPEPITTRLKSKGKFGLCYAGSQMRNLLYSENSIAGIASNDGLVTGRNGTVSSSVSALINERNQQIVEATPYLSTRSRAAKPGEKAMKVRRNLVSR
ncbi:MAG: Polynucleotide 5'-hydroxyl-kinase grc3 [Vezdaea aestivalis]|nr:MAG: Polynucleotide 5'-hydroxyl-kinase grc3 [Vezdaea aestivalis]